MLLATVAAATVFPMGASAQVQVTDGPPGSFDSLFRQTNRHAEISRVNIQSEAGSATYAPALRIVDPKGAVRYIRVGQQGLTQDIFYNDDALKQYTANFLSFNSSDTVALVPTVTPAADAQQQTQTPVDPVDPVDPVTPVVPVEPEDPPCICFFEGVCYDGKTGLLDSVLVPAIDLAGLTIADQDEAQRIALYATL